MTALEKLEALAAGPKPWLCTITLPDGSTRALRQPTKSMAKAHGARLAQRHGVDCAVTYAP